MEQFIRDNFRIVEWKNMDGSILEGFEYQDKNGFTCVTKLDFFIDNLEQFVDIIEHWEEQGYNVPE